MSNTITDEQLQDICRKTWADALPADYAALLQAITDRNATIHSLTNDLLSVRLQLDQANREIARLQQPRLSQNTIATPGTFGDAGMP